MKRRDEKDKPTREEMIAAGLWSADDPRDPTKDRNAAQVVIDWLMRAGWRFDFESRNGGFKAAFAKPWKRRSWAKSADECVAICRAALEVAA